MTDRELQDALDRLARSAEAPAPPPDGERSADWKAYRLLYTTLEGEPDGSLPHDFAQQVADRVMPAEALAPAAERFPWIEWVLPPLVLVVAFVTTLLLMPAVAQTGGEALQLVLNPLSALWTHFRLDIVLSAAAALLIVYVVDRFVRPAWFQKRPVATP